MSAPPLARRFGPYGGRYVPETLIPALDELEREWIAARSDPAFTDELNSLLRDFVGRPTPVYHARGLSEATGARGGQLVHEGREVGWMGEVGHARAALEFDLSAGAMVGKRSGASARFARDLMVDDGEPEDVDRLHHHDELLQVDRLGDVAVGVQVIGAQHVLLRLGGGEHHHRDGPQVSVALELLEHFPAVHAGEVQVEQDHRGAR